jgi:hypothetical protein
MNTFSCGDDIVILKKGSYFRDTLKYLWMEWYDIWSLFSDDIGERK